MFERYKEVRLLEDILLQSREQTFLLWQIFRRTNHHTPTTISFKEITMLPTQGGNTLVYTGTLSPAGTTFPAGTAFTVTSNDVQVIPTVDSTGLVVTVPLPVGWVEDPVTPLSISYSTSTFVPVPADGPSSLTATITPSAPPAALTPTSIAFNQTT